MNPTQPNSSSRLDGRERVELLLIGILAVILRAVSIRDQIFSDDEWHALRSAVGESYRSLYLDLSVAASPGLHILYKVLHDTIGLTEIRMRGPMLLAGVAATVVFPVVVAPWVDRLGRRLFALLLAISPLLVYYSRYARPYSISVFCAFVGLAAFLRWWRGEGRRWAVAYVLLATVGIYAHPGFAPTLLSALPLAVVANFAERDASRRAARWRSLVAVGFSTALAVGATIGPAVFLDLGALRARLGAARATLLTLEYSGELALGSGAPIALACLAALAVCGAVVLARQHPATALAVAGVAAATLVPNLLSTADSISIPIVFVRYSLWILPAVLLLVAIGAGRLLVPLQRRYGEGGPLVVSVAGVAALFAAGPLPATLAQPNAWTSHAIYVYAWRESDPFSYAPNLRPPHLPSFYGELAARPPQSVTIVEAPWFYEWHNNPLPFYQRVHRQRVVAGMLGTLCRQPRAILGLPPQAENLRFRNAVDLSVPAGLRYYDVDFLVLHRDLKAEMPRDAVNIQRAPNNNLLPSVVERCLPRIEAVYGKPIRDDADLVVWDLRAFAAARTPSSTASSGPARPSSR